MKLTKTKIIAIIVVIIIIFVVTLNRKDQEETIIEDKKIAKEVKTMNISKEMNTGSIISATGVVNPVKKVDVVATTDGTLRNLFFEVGDKVWTNKLLASMFSASTLTSLNNAKTFQNNSQANFEATVRSTEESIKQAEIGVDNALKGIESAELSLKNSRDNLENTKVLREKTIEDTKTNAVNSFHGNMNTVFDVLDKVNYIINYDEEEPQIPGIEKVLSVKNVSSLNLAELSYINLKASYNKLLKSTINSDNIKRQTEEMIEVMDKAIEAVDDTVTVLYNTISSTEFSEDTLNAQRNSYTALKSSIINTQSGTRATLQSLENLHLTMDQEIKILENNVALAESQVDSSQISYENALKQVDNAREAQSSQISASQISLDSATGQLRLSQTQASDLSIKAPISGTITSKLVEVGAELNPGQKIAEISNTKALKIEVGLASEDIYRIEEGAKVILMEGLEGAITSIDPAADPITKKVKIEITVDNKDNKLIQGTFIDVEIPTKKIERTNENSFFIPLKSIVITQSEKYIFIHSEGRAIKKNVVLGKTEGALIEILEGVLEGDELIIDGGKQLENNEEIITIDN